MWWSWALPSTTRNAEELCGPQVYASICVLTRDESRSFFSRKPLEDEIVDVLLMSRLDDHCHYITGMEVKFLLVRKKQVAFFSRSMSCRMSANLCQVQRFTSEWRRIVERFGYVAESSRRVGCSAFWYIFAPRKTWGDGLILTTTTKPWTEVLWRGGPPKKPWCEWVAVGLVYNVFLELFTSVQWHRHSAPLFHLKIFRGLNQRSCRQLLVGLQAALWQGPGLQETPLDYHSLRQCVILGQDSS